MPERSVERSLWRRYGASDRWMVGRLVCEQLRRIAAGVLLGVVVAGFLAQGFLHHAYPGQLRHLGHAWFSPITWIAVVVVAGSAALASVALPVVAWVARKSRGGAKSTS
jgi:hypothetical protein